MKIIILAFFCILTYNLKSQVDYIGNWIGRIETEMGSVGLVLRATEGEDSKIKMVLDIPEQGFSDISVTEIRLVEDSIFLGIKKIRSKYRGKINLRDKEISGFWWQLEKEYPLNFKKVDEIPVPKRPQHPQSPYPYIVEEVNFSNPKENINISGTLTLPMGKGPFPAIILVNGSGQQNRDSEIFGHKPFLVLADYLTKRGFAVIRYDDRGIGGSEGDFAASTTLDFAADATSALFFLRNHKSIDKNKIGIIGHSEGGLIAPMIASRQKDIAFLVLLAAPGIDIIDLMVIQNKMMVETLNILSEEEMSNLLKTVRLVFNTIIHNKDNTVATQKILTIYKAFTSTLSEDKVVKLGLTEGNIRFQLFSLLSPWFRYFIAAKPSTFLKRVKCPVLVLNGDKDLQVTANENLAGISEALSSGKNNNFEVHRLKGLNHLFQKAETGSVNEYAIIEETFNEDALKIIGDWLEKTIKTK